MRETGMTRKIPHPSWIEIDLNQFRKNLSFVRNHIGKSLYCLPIKGNAYGHGLCEIGAVAASCGVDCLGVAYLQEGVKLRKAGITIPILVFGAIHEDQIPDLVEYGFEFTLSSKYKAKLVHDYCLKINKKCRVHAEIDTGMQRTGVRASSAIDFLEYIKSLESLELVGIYSHFATADSPDHEFAQKQVKIFRELAALPFLQDPPVVVHMANSGGTAYFNNSHFHMVRPAQLSFGFYFEKTPPQFIDLSSCFSVKAKISYFKVVAAGQGISYGHTYVTSKQTRIVTIPMGYGDGYPRILSNRGSVLIRGKRFPIVGTICMDQFMVDVGDQEVYVGEEAVLIGKQGEEEISLWEVAKLCDTIPNEILCGFNDRIPKVYHGK